MTKEAWTIAAVAFVAGWVVLGLVWLLPKKWALLKRFGYHGTNEQLIELAKQGDPEARWLKDRSYPNLFVGLAIAVILAVLKP